MTSRQNRKNYKNRKNHNKDQNVSFELIDTMDQSNENKESTEDVDKLITIDNIKKVLISDKSDIVQTTHSEKEIGSNNNLNNELYTANITVKNTQRTDTKVKMSEYGYPMITYHSGLRNHIISVELDVGRKQALINNMDIGNCAPVELALLLKNIENELKKLAINNIVQQVTINDWQQILEPIKIYQLIHHNNIHNFVTAICPIEKFPEAVMKSLGFTDITNENI